MSYSISYRFLDYPQGNGLIVRTVHVPASEFHRLTNIGELPTEQLRHERRQRFVQQLTQEQLNAQPEVRRQIRVLGITHDYPRSWDVLHYALLVDAPGLPWNSAMTAIQLPFQASLPLYVRGQLTDKNSRLKLRAVGRIGPLHEDKDGPCEGKLRGYRDMNGRSPSLAAAPPAWGTRLLTIIADKG